MAANFFGVPQSSDSISPATNSHQSSNDTEDQQAVRVETVLARIEADLSQLHSDGAPCVFNGSAAVIPRDEVARLSAISEQIDRQMNTLAWHKAEVDRAIEAWQIILGAPVIRKEAASRSTEAKVRGADNGDVPGAGPSTQREEFADAVVAFLAQTGEALHFRDIYRQMSDQGLINIGGTDPASNLLTRYSSDSRLERVSRGRYRAKQRDAMNFPE